MGGDNQPGSARQGDHILPPKPAAKKHKSGQPADIKVEQDSVLDSFNSIESALKQEQILNMLYKR